MANCPFLSYYPINTMVGSDPVDESVPSTVTPFEYRTFTYSYANRVNVACMTTSCQIWDPTNSRCGMLVSNTIMNSSVNETATLITLLETVIGKASERDSSKSIVVWLKDIIGITSERDTSRSIVSWLKDIVGVASERDASKSIVAWLKDIIGITSEKDASKSIVAWLKDIIGITSEKDASKSIVAWLKNIIGITSEKDSNNSIVSWLKNVIGNTASATEEIITHPTSGGPCQECGAPATLINLLKHADSDHDNSVSGGGSPMAVTLIVEYQCEQDQDTNSKIYGKDFKCITNTPKILLDLEKNPTWVQPPLATTWAEYTAWRAGGAAPVFITNPDL